MYTNLIPTPANPVKQAYQTIDLFKPPAHVASPPNTTIREPTTAELAPDEVAAAEEKRTLLIMNDLQPQPSDDGGESPPHGTIMDVASGGNVKNMETIFKKFKFIGSSRVKKAEEEPLSEQARLEGLAVASAAGRWKVFSAD